MSAYPSLLSPLMDATGLISTSALNTTAQTALAAGTYAASQVDVLKITALQESAGSYTGLGATDMIIDGNITCSTINYTTLNPPVSGTSETLSQVLANGNDGGFNSMVNLDIIYCNIVNATNDGGTSLSQFNNFEIYKDKGFQRTAIINAEGNTAVQNYYLYGVQPSDFAITHDKNILTTGNITCNQLNYSTLNPPIAPSATPTLSDVLTAGNSASTNINLSNHSLTNVNTTTTQYIAGVGGVITCNNSVSIPNINQNITTGILNTDNNCVMTGYGSFTASQSITSGSSLVVRTQTPGTADKVELNQTDATIRMPMKLQNNTYPYIDHITLNNDTGAITCTTVNDVAVQFRPTYDYYVSKNGSDSGLGSALSPFLTVQHAITVCEAFVDGVPRVVHLSSGTFSENLVFSKSRISIIGEGNSMNPDVGSSISGTITINLASGNSDLNNNNIYFSGLLLNGTIEDSVSAVVHRLFFTDCYLYANDRCLYMHPTGDYRLFVDRCSISNSSTAATNPIFDCRGSGMISVTNSKITSKGLTQMTMYITDTVRVDTFAQNIITNDSTSTQAQCILGINTTQTISIGSCAFLYSSFATKTFATYHAAGIWAFGSGDFYIINCFFSLLGLYAPQNAIQNAGSGKVYFGLNSAPSSTFANSISGILGTGKVALLSVQ